MILYLLIGLLTLAVVGQWVLIYKLEKTLAWYRYRYKETQIGKIERTKKNGF